MFSILHITDLHRSKSEPLSNAELLSALISDRDNYVREEPPVRPPDAIVVSGDIIQGVGLGADGFQAELAAQYEVAHDFLAALADRFLDGDRSRLVIVPGNHDIDWNTAFAAMEEVTGDAIPKDLPGALYEPGSAYRWDWKTRRLYKIKNPDLYRQRLAAFWTFFERFYAGASGMLRVEPWSNANLFSLDDGRIGLAAFNSCEGNDCFAFHGAISRELIARAHMDLKDIGPWRLRIAVWHHDVEGPPHRTDYMDADIVRGMIGRGFRLGLYGHQHRTQITPQRARLLEEDTMVIASAGSLCAGHKELPTGALRGYSIVEVRDDYAGARVHVREMNVANLFSRATLRDFAGRSYVDLDWTMPVDAAGRAEDPVATERRRLLDAAEQALRANHDPAGAVSLLEQLDLAEDSYGRRLFVEAARATGDPEQLIRAVGRPDTIEELIWLVDALIKTGAARAAQDALEDHGNRLHLPEPLRADLELKVKLASWSGK